MIHLYLVIEIALFKFTLAATYFAEINVDQFVKRRTHFIDHSFVSVIFMF